jgi:uncharacterized membrane protein YeaQ/YmgE (transglycosylase-associated protein family)
MRGRFLLAVTFGGVGGFVLTWVAAVLFFPSMNYETALQWMLVAVPVGATVVLAASRPWKRRG